MPETPPLREAEIHVWYASLDRPPVPLGDLRSCLSEDELARSARFAFDEHRGRFEAGHGLMRQVLGAYSCRPAEELEFSIGPEGKPSLKGDGGAGPDIDFNVSDSAGHFLMGVTLGAPLGVDVERVRPVPDLEHIAKRFFAPAEAAHLMSLPAGQRERAFLECWTRKEAFVKAVGSGLQLPLDSFEVIFGPERTPAFHTVNGSEAEAARWSLWGFDTPDEEAIGAVAVREAGRSLVHVSWDDSTTLRRRTR